MWVRSWILPPEVFPVKAMFQESFLLVALHLCRVGICSWFLCWAAFGGLGDLSGRMGSDVACSGRACWCWQGTGEILERSGSSRSKGRGTELANLEAGNKQGTLRGDKSRGTLWGLVATQSLGGRLYVQCKKGRLAYKPCYYCLSCLDYFAKLFNQVYSSEI